MAATIDLKGSGAIPDRYEGPPASLKDQIETGSILRQMYDTCKKQELLVYILFWSITNTMNDTAFPSMSVRRGMSSIVFD